MAQFDPTPPSFAGVRYDIGNVPNIGAGYAAGIAQAGQGIAEGVKGALDVMNRRQNATDMLNAMHQGGMLSDQAYKSIGGKSLGAQEQMLGMYANQWILDQANQRALSLARGQGGIEVATQHAKLLDTINLAKGQNARVMGLPGGGPWQGGQPQPPAASGPPPAASGPPITAGQSPLLPGAQYGMQGGKLGWRLPSGQFVVNPGAVPQT